jgi:hypothetical protein
MKANHSTAGGKTLDSIKSLRCHLQMRLQAGEYDPKAWHPHQFVVILPDSNLAWTERCGMIGHCQRMSRPARLVRDRDALCQAVCHCERWAALVGCPGHVRCCANNSLLQKGMNSKCAVEAKESGMVYTVTACRDHPLINVCECISWTTVPRISRTDTVK